MQILRFSDFINEQSVYNVGIPIFRGTAINPEKTVKRNKLLPELQDYLSQLMSGQLTEVTLVAEIPTQGKNAPQYLKDIYSEMGYDASKEEDMYDDETDTFLGNRDRMPDDPSTNIFVDSEFIVKDVDMERNVILAIPYSMKRKGIIIEIAPEMVEEVFIK